MRTRRVGGWRNAAFGLFCFLAAGAAVAQQDVGALLDRVDDLYNRGRYAEALNVCQQAAALAPDSPDVFDYRGTVLLELRRYDEAERDFQRALNIGHANPARCHSQLGNVYAAQGRHEEAVAAYTESLRLDPNSPGRYINRGVEYRLMGKPERAIADFKKALQLRAPDQAGVLSNLGNAYADLERFSEALDSYNRAVEIEPDNFGARINRGVFFLRRGDYAAALKDLDRAVQLNPDNAVAYANRGETHVAMRNYSSALKDLDRALQLDPQQVQALAARGHVRLAQHRPEKALADFAAATRVDRRHLWSHEGAGEAYLALKKYDKAEAEYNFVIQSDPQGAWGYGNRAELYVKLGRLDEALRDVTRALQLAPEDGGLYAVRALVWAARKEFPKALEDSKKAEALIPEEAEVYLDRARIWIELGERDKALKDLRKAQQLDAGDPETKDLLATLAAAPPAPRPTPPAPAVVPRACPECGKAVNTAAKFCPTCGARVPPAAPVRTEPCPACHAPLTPAMKFCPNCGARIEGAAIPGGNAAPPVSRAEQPAGVPVRTPPDQGPNTGPHTITGPVRPVTPAGSPEATAIAFRQAFLARDLAALARNVTEDNREFLDEVARQGPDHPEYREVFDEGWQAAAMRAWNGLPGTVRYPSPGKAWVSIGEDADGQIIVLAMELENGQWKVEDASRIERAGFEQAGGVPAPEGPAVRQP